MKSNNLILNRLFTQNIFNNLLINYNNSVYETIINKLNISSFINNKDIISKIYKYMEKNYRNEYFYQNTLINKWLLGRHSVNTTTALTQISIGKSKADFILINGKAVVYEIKTELDTFERLKTQLNDYYKGFDHVCVVTCENNKKKIMNILKDTKVGVCLLTDKNTLQTLKKPEKNMEYLNHIAIFKILRKKEYENIIFSYFKELPKIAPVFYYDECLKYFKQIPLEIVYKLMLRELKKRNRVKKEEFAKIPYELKSLVYFYGYSEHNYSKIFEFLNKEYRR